MLKSYDEDLFHENKNNNTINNKYLLITEKQSNNLLSNIFEKLNISDDSMNESDKCDFIFSSLNNRLKIRKRDIDSILFKRRLNGNKK